MATSKNREIFSDLYFSYLWDYKATLSGGHKYFFTIVKKLENKIIHTNRITWNILKPIANYQNALVSKGFKYSELNLKLFKINAMLVGKETKIKSLT